MPTDPWKCLFRDDDRKLPGLEARQQPQQLRHQRFGVDESVACREGSASRHRRERFIAQHRENASDLRATDGAESVEKIIQRLTRLEVIEKCTQRHAGAAKHRYATLDLGVALHKLCEFDCTHDRNLSLTDFSSISRYAPNERNLRNLNFHARPSKVGLAPPLRSLMSRRRRIRQPHPPQFRYHVRHLPSTEGTEAAGGPRQVDHE